MEKVALLYSRHNHLGLVQEQNCGRCTELIVSLHEKVIPVQAVEALRVAGG
jgi:hypothetical protein